MHAIESIMQVTMTELQKMVDVNTIVGDPVSTPDGTTIIPVSKVSLGFVSGGGEYNEKKKESSDVGFPFAGGGGAGLTVMPIAFLSVYHHDVRLIPVQGNNMAEALIEKMPHLISEIKKIYQNNQ